MSYYFFLADESTTVSLNEYLSNISIQLFHPLSLCLLTVSHPVTECHCGHCCSLLLSVLCNGDQSQTPTVAWRSVAHEAKWTHHNFPLDRMTQQHQMIAVKGKACWQTHCTHIGHLFCCYCKQTQPSMSFFSITHLPKYEFSFILSPNHTQTN